MFSLIHWFQEWDVSAHTDVLSLEKGRLRKYVLLPGFIAWTWLLAPPLGNGCWLPLCNRQHIHCAPVAVGLFWIAVLWPLSFHPQPLRLVGQQCSRLHLPPKHWAVIHRWCHSPRMCKLYIYRVRDSGKCWRRSIFYLSHTSIHMEYVLVTLCNLSALTEETFFPGQGRSGPVPWAM